ncbi:hypothetical protein ACRN9Z_13305 [Shewanella frigidimarina]|uniref:hypothetical protein n=1 Tax=Shewanella frigidimarina TaxID=56812 RepID=UPI003D7ADCA4
MKVGIFSLTYNSRGHSKEYIDNLIKNLDSNYEFELISYDQKVNDSGVGILDYNSSQRFSSYRKIFRRFFCSLQLLYIQYSKLKSCDKILFSDYEYFSLLFILFIFKRKKNIVWVHSATLNGSVLYYVYKKIFFKFVNKLNVFEYIVNGQESYKLLSKLIDKKITLIQYPSELSMQPLNKELAKKKLGFNGKKIFSLLGMIRADKNYEFAIKSFSKSTANNSNGALLVIAGAPSGINSNQIDRWLNMYNVKNVYKDYNYLSEERLNCTFSATDVLLIPYGENCSSQSGPLSLCRNYLIPAIVREGGEIGNYVSYFNVGLTCSSSKDFSDAINKYNSSIPNVTLKSLNEVKNLFSWSSAAKKYIEVFER